MHALSLLPLTFTLFATNSPAQVLEALPEAPAPAESPALSPAAPAPGPQAAADLSLQAASLPLGSLEALPALHAAPEGPRKAAAEIGASVASGDLSRASEKLDALFAQRGLQAAPEDSLLVDRVGDLSFVQIKVDGFEALPLDQKVLAYHLSNAATAGWDIVFQQMHRQGLAIRRQLERVVAHPEGVDPAVYEKIRRYALRFWAMRSFYDKTTQMKFLPEFTRPEWIQANLQADPGRKPSEILESLDETAPAMFDPAVDPLLKNVADGVDKIRSSGGNFYEGLTESEVEAYQKPKTALGLAKAWARWLLFAGWHTSDWPYARHPENSRLVKKDGRIQEEVHRAGDPARGVPPGAYAESYSRIIENVAAALPHAGPAQAEALRHLIRYFKTGDPKDFRNYNIAWVKDGANVDANIGPIEVYDDPMALKATYEGTVNMIDPRMEELRDKIAALGPYLEANAPWDKKFKKDKFNPPNIRFVQDLMRTGAMGGATHTVGKNLPNDKNIVEKYGSKSAIMRNIIPSLDAATQGKARKEFSFDPERDAALAGRWGDIAETLMIGLHEGAGHALGRVDPALKGLPPEHLKQFYPGLEEARAELAALWFVADPQLQGRLVPSKEAAEWAYRSFMTNQGLTKMYRLPRGSERWTGAHDIARNLIVNYLLGFPPEELAKLEKSGVRGLKSVAGALEARKKDGKTFIEVVDFAKAREAVGRLMSEIMRIIGEGDFAAAKALVEAQGYPVRQDWLAEVKDRYEKLGLHLYAVEIQPELVPVRDEGGNIVDVKVSLPRDFAGQMLRFGGVRP